jgi:hypothetical protein
MSAKRAIATDVEAWIKREAARADECQSKIDQLERYKRDSLRRVECLKAMLDASDFLNAPSADEEAGF